MKIFRDFEIATLKFKAHVFGLKLTFMFWLPASQTSQTNMQLYPESVLLWNGAWFTCSLISEFTY